MNIGASQITAINVFVEIDGQQCIAIIDPQMAQMFMGMLGAYQSGQPEGARLTRLPDDASGHLLAARQAIADRTATLHRASNEKRPHQ